MFSKGRKKGTVRFAYQPLQPVQRVQLAGDFNDWQPTPMRKQKSGQYVAQIPLEPGIYEYRFLVDDDWLTDPDHGTMAMNPYGTFNSVADVTDL